MQRHVNRSLSMHSETVLDLIALSFLDSLAASTQHRYAGFLLKVHRPRRMPASVENSIKLVVCLSGSIIDPALLEAAGCASATIFAAF